jgi:hypothetical protein
MRLEGRSCLPSGSGASVALAAGLVGVLAVAAWAAPASRVLSVRAAVASSGPTFGNPTISGIQGTGFEQDVRVDSRGRIYTSAPGSIAAAISYVYRSLDGGQTFKLVPAAVQPQGKLALTCPAGGGDTELATDSAGNLYFNDLYAANFATARSADQGRTFAPSTCTGVTTTPDDRQWYAVDGNPTAGGSITLAYNVPPNLTPLPNPNKCVDNILVFSRSPVVAGATAGVEFGPLQTLNQPCDGNEGIMGNDEVFTYPNFKRAFVIHDNDPLNQIRAARCDLVAFTASPTGYANCSDRLISSFPTGITGANFPTLAIDRAGNLLAVWEQTPYDSVTKTTQGDTLLYYSVSTDAGDHWSVATELPTPGLHTNVFAWPAAGDAGRVVVAWYGTAAQAAAGGQGPDSVNGDWGLYMTQSLNFTSASPTWSVPVLASEHAIHRGSMFTLIGGQTGDRTLGDFLQVRAGAQGEAVISYSDSNSDTQFHSGGPSNVQGIPQGMVVRQNGGPSLFARVGSVHGPARRINSVQVGDHAATLDSAGLSSSAQPNLEILGSRVSMPNPSTYRIEMQVADLRSLAPKGDITAFGPTLVWDTQWKVPSTTDPNGGAFFHTYMESTAGGNAVFYAGQDSATVNGAGAPLAYPGSVVVSGSYTATAPGVITIDVPTSAVQEPGAVNGLLYGVTAATMALSAPAETVPNSGGVGGELFSLVDVAPAYDFDPSRPTPGFNACHEGDGHGQVAGPRGGTANFSFEQDKCEDGGGASLSEQDSSSNTDFHATQISSIALDDLTHSVTITGEGDDNGVPCAFTAIAIDNGLLPGLFSLTLGDGYAVSGTLLNGGIQLQ